MSTTPRLNLYTVPLMLNVKQGNCEYQFLKSFGMARQRNEPTSTTTRRTLLPLHHRSYHYTITAQSSVAEPASTNIDKQKNDRPEQQALALSGSKFC